MNALTRLWGNAAALLIAVFLVVPGCTSPSGTSALQGAGRFSGGRESDAASFAPDTGWGQHSDSARGDLDAGRSTTDSVDTSRTGRKTASCKTWAKKGMTWRLPDAMFDVMAWQWSPFTWSLLDLNGDGRLDLVHTEDPESKGHPFSSAGIGSHWRVYVGGPKGFAPSAVQWTLPSDTFHAPTFQQGVYRWAMVELTGDQRLDLVLTGDPKSQGSAYVDDAGAFWRVHRNTGKGFEANAQIWRVPDVTFDMTSAFSGKWTWSTVDLNGDGWLDLVHTENPTDEGQAFSGAASPHWRVYLGAAGGFAAQATLWAVPGSDIDALYASTGKWGWWTLDADGDGRADLVHTEDPNAEGRAFGGKTDPHWRVYQNTGGGFAPTATLWAVPSEGFDSVTVQFNEWSWSTLDLNGDGYVDLVHTEDPTAQGKAFDGDDGNHWRVYWGGSGGFASDWAPWPVPRPEIDAVWSYGDWGAWGVLDLNGDGCVDWVDTRDPASKSSAYVGPTGAHWRAHFGL